MRFAKGTFLFCIFFMSLTLHPHDPEYFVISEIERGQLNFENEKIAEEYRSALKRQRIRRLNAMPWLKKIYVFVKAGFEHIIPLSLIHI